MITVEFTLNQNNEIVEVGREWDKFALENNAPELSGDTVIGRSLFDFISGAVTKNYILSLLEVARSRNDAVNLDYRCDSPHQRRYMNMCVRKLDAERVLLVHTVLRNELRSSPIYFTRMAIRGKNTYIRCSMCGFVLTKKSWVEPDVDSGLKSKTEIYVTYGLCPTCQLKLAAV